MDRIEIGPKTFVVVATGAGISAESGLATFRGAGGLWEGHRVEEVASPEGFAADAQLVWRFYSERRKSALAVEPNAGHLALAKLEEKLGDRFLLATQNVDGLHRRAGSKRVIAIHGELFESRCAQCFEPPFEDKQTYLEPPMPKCQVCGMALRPNIVWFGEALDHRHLRQVREAFEDHRGDCVFIAIGTSGQVYPAAGFVDQARSFGAKTWLVDLDPAHEFAARFHHVVRGKSGEVLPQLFG
jgi:NAD-dependent deacetylase